MLPLMNDVEEREFCNNYLLDILQNTSLLRGIVQSNNAKMIGKLMQIMAVSIVNDDKAKEKYQDLFKIMNNECDSKVIQQSISILANDLKSAFQKR